MCYDKNEGKQSSSSKILFHILAIKGFFTLVFVQFVLGLDRST